MFLTNDAIMTVLVLGSMFWVVLGISAMEIVKERPWFVQRNDSEADARLSAWRMLWTWLFAPFIVINWLLPIKELCIRFKIHS